ncbi:MAG: xylulokinase [Anaerolineae bacterium]
MRYLLGVDVSTTGAKALLIDERGTVIDVENTALSLQQPRPLWSEQNPDEWWQGAAQSIRAVTQRHPDKPIAAVGLTGQMHGLTLLDAQGQVLRPAILWNDQRTQAQCDEITAKVGFERLIQLTGNRALTGFTAPKILWVREHEPEVYARIAHILLPKDYIRYKLTGQTASDMSDSAGTSLLDVANRRWSQEVLDALDIPNEWLPTLHEGTEITGEVTAQAAEQTGLTAGTPVVGGGGDQAAGAVGVGAVRPEVIGLSVGTSGVVFAPLSQYAYEPEGRLHAFCHALPDAWHFMGVMLSAAGSLQWYRDTLAPDTSFDALMTEAANAPAGCEGLRFLPYLTGERTPHPDPLARGGFVGLTARHTRAHLTRAVLEGVAFGLRDCFELIRAVGIPSNAVARIGGGGARSMLWRQIIADVIGMPVASVNTTEGAALGAALLAAVGVGIYPDAASACDACISTTEIVQPSAEAPAYEQPYREYVALYPAIRPVLWG